MLPVLVQGQVAVKGQVTEQNSGNKPIPGVQIKALGTTPEVTGNDGLFQLVFTGKKPGDRIIVSEIAKKGFEIVNKELVNNWLIANDPNHKSKIVMCPEGMIAQNTLKYYDISLTGLTRGYQERIRVLQEQKEKAEIDAKSYGEQAKELAEQYEKQQKQLEELAEKFARENFDDCSAIHRDAFEAFKSGNIAGAIRILESVNSADEIARAQEQKEKGKLIEKQGKMMQAESESIIRQNISKLMFQADLYRSQFRFADAEKAWETALYADTTDLANIFTYVAYLLDMFRTDDALRWNRMAMDQAKSDKLKAHAHTNMGWVFEYMKRYSEAGTAFEEAVAIYRKIATDDVQSRAKLAYALGNLADFYYDINLYENALTLHEESVQIWRDLAKADPASHNPELARHLQNKAQVQVILNRLEQAKANYQEAIGIERELSAREHQKHQFGLAWALIGLAGLSDPDSAELYYLESIALMRDLAANNPQQWSSFLARSLTKYADMQRGQRKFQEAKTVYGEAFRIIEEAMKVNPVEFSEVYAMVLTNLASTEEDLDDFHNAQLHYDMAVKTWRELVQANQDIFGKELASMLHNRAFMYRRLNEYSKAESDYLEAIGIYREAVRNNPEEITRLLATSLFVYSTMLYERNESDKALPISEESMRWFEVMAAKQPERYRSQVAHLYGSIAYTQVKQKQFVQAEGSARKGLELDSMQTWIYTNLALALLFQDRYDEALKIYMEWKDQPFHGHPPTTFREAFLKDFDDLEKIGLKHRDMKKIKKMLVNSE